MYKHYDFGAHWLGIIHVSYALCGHLHAGWCVPAFTLAFSVRLLKSCTQAWGKDKYFVMLIMSLPKEHGHRQSIYTLICFLWKREYFRFVTNLTRHISCECIDELRYENDGWDLLFSAWWKNSKLKHTSVNVGKHYKYISAAWWKDHCHSRAARRLVNPLWACRKVSFAKPTITGSERFWKQAMADLWQVLNSFSCHKVLI